MNNWTSESELEGKATTTRIKVMQVWQAPGFYERHGYRVLVTIPCNPPGTSRIFLTKTLG